MYQAIIFDLGNVLINISYPRIFDYWSQVTGRKLDDAQGVKSEIIDGEEMRFEVGQISAADFRRNVAAKIGFKINDSDFDKGWNNIFVGINPGIELVLKRLKPEYRLVGLSNTNQIHTDMWRKQYPEITKYFEKFFCSHEIGRRKPNADAFQIVLDYLQLAPVEVIFIDDNHANVEGANRLGITGILMQSAPQLVTDLHNLGIKVDRQPEYDGMIRNANMG
jgi:glucose-1-phosphatase